MNIVASAPGKLVLLGEYAVLEGAPAIAMAVNRRAVVQLVPRLGLRCEAHAPDVVAQRLSFTIGSDGRPDWQNAAADCGKLGLVDDVLCGLADEHGPALAERAFALALDTHDFFDTVGRERHKLGLGSSAALTVALATALVAHAGRGAAAANRRVWLQRLLALHRQFQGGHGSGVDVATSLIGGVITYQLTADEEGNSGHPLARDVVWPEAVAKLFIWSGTSASTPQLLARLRAWQADHDAAYRSRMTQLTEIAEVAVAALGAADADRFMTAAADYATALRALGTDSGVPIFSAEHAAIAGIAEKASGVVYKPCGAGGGDVGVLFSTDPARLAFVAARLVEAGFICIPLAVDDDGLRLEYTEIDEA